MYPIDLVVFIMAYVLTGISITAYDYAAPRIHRKAYVIKRNIPLTLLLCLIWPFPALIDANDRYNSRKGCARFISGIVSLFCAFYLWGWAISGSMRFLLQNQLLAYAISGVALLFLMPLFTILSMPRYTDADERSSRIRQAR